MAGAAQDASGILKDRRRRAEGLRPLLQPRAGRAAVQGGRAGLRHQSQPAPAHGPARVRARSVPDGNAGRRNPGDEAGRLFHLQRAGRSRRRAARGFQHSENRRVRASNVWNLLRPPAARAGVRRPDLQAQVRPPRREPAGQGFHHRQGRDHLPEPRVLRGQGFARSGPRRDNAHQPERQDLRGHAAQEAAGVLGAVPPRGLPRPARLDVSVRAVHGTDGGKPNDTRSG